ncbi:hypothetical protein LCGC14_2723120, partial [marine sediment metagenome]
QLADLLNHGWYDLVGRMPLRLLGRMGVEATIDDSPTSHTMDTGKILSVRRSDGTVERECREVPANLQGRLSDQYSVDYADKTWPAYYISGNVLNIFPTPSATEIAKVIEVGLAADIAVADTSVAGFDPGLTALLVLYVVIGLKLREAGLMRRNSQDELEAITISGYLVSFEAALPTFTGPPSPSMPTLTLTERIVLPSLSLSGATDSWPTFTSTLTLPTLSLSVMTTLPDFGSVSITSPGSLTMPTVPDLPSLVLDAMGDLPADLSAANVSFSGVTAPTYITPAIGTAVGTLSITNKTVTDPGTLSLPANIVLPILSLTTAPTFAGMTLSSVPSATLAYSSAGIAPPSTVTIATSIPTFSAPSAFTYSSTVIDDALTKAEKLVDDATGMSQGDDIEGFLAADKPEKARAQTTLATQEVNRATAAIQDEV